MYYEEVLLALNDHGVKYLVAGGIAVNLHGVPRMTTDLDILADMSKENLLNLARAMNSLGFRPRVPVKAEAFADREQREKWKREKNMLVFSFISPEVPYESVDILISSPVSYDEAVSRRNVFKAGEIEIPVVSIDDLVKMKREAAREQDFSDIEMLLKIRKAGRSNQASES